MKNLRIIAIGMAVIIIILLGIFFFYSPSKAPTIPGGQDGGTGVTASVLYSADKTLEVDSLRVNDSVASPLVITGSVTNGDWFFEGSFPVKILDGNGAVLGTSPAAAESDWMSTGTVPFRVSLTFTKPKYSTGTVVLENDNPSGFKANQKELRIPVRFAF